MTRLRKQCLMTERRWRQRDVIVTVTVTPAQSLRLVTACSPLSSLLSVSSPAGQHCLVSIHQPEMSCDNLYLYIKKHDGT